MNLFDKDNYQLVFDILNYFFVGSCNIFVQFYPIFAKFAFK